MAEVRVELNSGAVLLLPSGSTLEQIYQAVDAYNAAMHSGEPPVQRPAG